MHARDQNVVNSINDNHRNCKYLKETRLPDSLTATCTLNSDLFLQNSVVLISIPTQAMRKSLETIKPFLSPSHLLIFVNKGIECSTLQLPSDIVTEVLGEELGSKACFLSGPSFAIEVVGRQPTCVSVASRSSPRAKRTQRLFHSPCFRVYDIEDVQGLEVAGALKNVIAIASGACAGAGYQANARAAIITRGLAEITRFGVVLGADPITFAGLSGVGDLFLTCTSEKSRNYTVGYRLGKGEGLKEIVESLGSVAEGVATTKAAYDLARKIGVETPIIDQAYAVLYEEKPLAKAFEELTNREASPEFRGILK